jgi:hypothetical protein
MRKNFFSRTGTNAATAVAALLILTIIGFKKAPDTNKAEVNIIQGMMIFTDSRPVSTYTYIGTISGTFAAMNPQYTNVRDKIISKVKIKFPEANAIIFNLNSGGADKADAVKIQP